jgi:hypothetical protein
MQSRIVQSVILWAIEFGLVAWAGVTWRGIAQVKWSERQMRSKLAVISYLAATAGLIYQLYMVVHAQITGGYGFYSAPTLAYIRYGLLLALAGLIIAAFSKGSPRVRALSINFLMLLFTLTEAAVQ